MGKPRINCQKRGFLAVKRSGMGGGANRERTLRRNMYTLSHVVVLFNNNLGRLRNSTN